MANVTQLPNGDFMDFGNGINFFLDDFEDEIQWRMLNTTISKPTSCAITNKVSDTPMNRKHIYQELLKLFNTRKYTIEYLK